MYIYIALLLKSDVQHLIKAIKQVPLRQYLGEVPTGDGDLHTFQSLLSFPVQVMPEITRSRNMQLPR